MVWKNVSRRLKLKNRKSLKPILLIIGLTLFFTSCEKESKILVLEIDIAELVCMDGQKIFEGRILELEGIRAVSANIQTRKALIRYRDSQVSSLEIKAHLAEFGFTLDGEPGNTIARGRLPQCCFNKQFQP